MVQRWLEGFLELEEKLAGPLVEGHAVLGGSLVGPLMHDGCLELIWQPFVPGPAQIWLQVYPVDGILKQPGILLTAGIAVNGWMSWFFENLWILIATWNLYEHCILIESL